MEAALRSAPQGGATLPNAASARIARLGFIGLLVALSTLCGLAVGFYLGFHTGVKPALHAAASLEGASLTKALPWKSEIATETAEKQEIARLLDDVRANRAQIEAMRHFMENSRMVERFNALETARETSVKASRSLEKIHAAILARLDRLEERLNRAPPGVDPAPTSAISKSEPGKGDATRKAKP